jgi:hypothetical protein
MLTSEPKDKGADDEGATITPSTITRFPPHTYNLKVLMGRLGFHETSNARREILLHRFGSGSHVLKRLCWHDRPTGAETEVLPASGEPGTKGIRRESSGNSFWRGRATATSSK